MASPPSPTQTSPSSPTRRDAGPRRSGKLHYFGPWADPEAALAKYLEQRDDLYAGRKPRCTGPAGLTVRDLANRFMTAKKLLMDSGRIAARTWQDYYTTCERLVGELGKDRLVDDLASDDFEKLFGTLTKTRGLVALGNEIQRTRAVFKFAYDAGLIDKPIRYGPVFRRPGKREMRKERAGKGLRMFEAEELRAMLSAAGMQLKAMILLGVNCGFGNADCGSLPRQAVDLDGGWVRFPRPKTGVERWAPLWPETVEALRAVLESRQSSVPTFQPVSSM